MRITDGMPVLNHFNITLFIIQNSFKNDSKIHQKTSEIIRNYTKKYITKSKSSYEWFKIMACWFFRCQRYIVWRI